MASAAPMTPLLATTHDHCPVRGRVRTASGLKDTMSEVTMEWAPALAAAYARLLTGALAQVVRPSPIPDTALPREAADRAAGALGIAAVSKRWPTDLTVRPKTGDLSTGDDLCRWMEAAKTLLVPSPGWADVLDPSLVREGRDDEESMLEKRESRAQELRERFGAPAEEVGEKPLELGVEARVHMGVDQWSDPEARPILHQLSAPKVARDLPDGGGGGRVIGGRSYRVAADGVLETAVFTGPALPAEPREALWVIVVPATPAGRGPAGGLS